MAQVTLLTQGYARRHGRTGKIQASPTSVLIEDSGVCVLVDPGANASHLLEALSRLGLTPKDVDLIFLTHYHLDHLLNIRLFPEVDVCDQYFLYREDCEIPHPHEGAIPGTKIEAIPTPGHSPEHASLLAETDEGACLIAGDLFWWFDDAEQKTDIGSLLSLEDELASDLAALKNSRKMALDVADWIVPGHGRPFYNPGP